jgi:hypothetical protein
VRVLCLSSPVFVCVCVGGFVGVCACARASVCARACVCQRAYVLVCMWVCAHGSVRA